MVFEKLLAVHHRNQMWESYLAYEKALIGTLDQELNGSDKGAAIATSGIATLRQDASVNDASIEVLYHATSAMLTALPLRLRDSRLTVEYAAQLVALSHRKVPTYLLLLAQAYRADGQMEKANATAHEGLNLLPPRQAGTPAVRCRTLLEQITSAGHSKS
jgi:hypothetical protein